MRIGHGYDVHAFAENRRLVLGGVLIPHSRGLAGHSDADVLIHALCDALLGAAALGDIGKHFPDTGAEFKNIDSRILLRRVKKLLMSANYTIENIDSTIVAQKPKLMSYLDKMTKNISEDLSIQSSQINIKATTTEKLGFAGKEEGIAAYAVVLLK